MIQGHGGNIYELAREMGCAPEDIIDLSSNVNPYGPPPGLVEFLKERMPDIMVLPEVDAAGIRAGPRILPNRPLPLQAKGHRRD